MGLEQQLADVQAAVEALTEKFTSVDKATKQLDRLRKRIQAAKRRAANAEERAAEAYWSAYRDQKAAAEMRARDAIQEQLEQIAAEERGAMHEAIRADWQKLEESIRVIGEDRDCFEREAEATRHAVEEKRRQLRSMESEMETARRWLAFVHEAISAEESHLECIKAEVAAASAPTERYATVLQQTAQAAAARIISGATRRANDIVTQALSKSAPQPVTAERRTP